MFRIETDMMTGESVEIPLTDEELAAAEAASAAELQKPPPASAASAVIELLKSDPNAIAALKAELSK